MKPKGVIITLAVAGVLLGGYLILKSARSGPPVITVLRVTVMPKEELGFVADKANSPMFKYLMSKKTGVRPGLAQKLEAKAVPNSALLEAKVGVLSKEEGQRFAEAFVEVPQDFCGKQVQLTLAEQAVH